MRAVRRALWVPIALAALAWGAGCASAPSERAGPTGIGRAQSVEGSSVELPTTVIRAGEAPIDIDVAFREAFAAFQAGSYAEAIAKYAVIIDHTEEVDYRLPALFNSGLAHERLGQWDEAAALYEEMLSRFPDHPDAKDALFRRAHALHEGGHYAEAADLMTETLLRGDLAHFDRVEAHLRRAEALLASGDLVGAEDGFRTIITLNQSATPEERLSESAPMIAQTELGLGRALHAQMSAIPLALPTDRMGENLRKKMQLFTQAQSAYIRAIRVHVATWSLAAGHSVGSLYEDFYLDILGAEVPGFLTDEQLRFYFDELHKKIDPVMRRAIEIHEKTISLSRRIPSSSSQADDWVAASRRRIERLKLYLDDPRTRRRAERLAARGRPLEEIWDPRAAASDALYEALERARLAASGATPMVRLTPARHPTGREERARPR